ncbi:hypothetical protein AMATHDRAFT_3247 [Amanita thiersii Skay4041]|uniref:Rhodanese domain-containing protein n=1 Tax=Amanita thiersii Skay4041 TaxID=703135 RepID=A0A2A9NUD2_9AGAR|nr:hypothetical protein AMATHDRAFT_3247 [Amanita thiersii Skay4041]
MDFEFISGDKLADIMKRDAAGKDYLVIDVRDDDYHGGNIVNAINHPSIGFSDRVDELVKSTKDIPVLVFHCFLSQLRGPKAARLYMKRRRVHFGAEAGLSQRVYVLEGGFEVFQAKFKDDPTLVENWKKSVWEIDVNDFVQTPAAAGEL